ncbi:hypothetical protein F2P81_002535 [Scophthalmus maximus]|uniref:Uncharacterized protein n=1 Tax=Scophthalmus maximus TaxID=52904 RepID=A0A6A4TEM6_SCOMX|nr:hypothetical protein F2P81_002535 [Scophthalmus maximus]
MKGEDACVLRRSGAAVSGPPDASVFLLYRAVAGDRQLPPDLAAPVKLCDIPSTVGFRSLRGRLRQISQAESTRPCGLLSYTYSDVVTI